MKQNIMKVGNTHTVLKKIFRTEENSSNLVIVAMGVLVGTLGLFAAFTSPFAAYAVAPSFDVTDTYVVSFDGFEHDMILAQDNTGAVTGGGSYPTGTPNEYEWTITSGIVSGNTIDLTSTYTLGATGTILHMAGAIANDGSMSGTWEDDFGGARSGVWSTVSGNAVAIATGTVNVTINKFIDGAMATSGSASNVDFPMSATWNASNIGGAGSGTYTLSETDTVPYEAMTVDMNVGADYSTNEVVTPGIVGATCATGTPFALLGYTTGDTYAAAASGTPTATIPTFTNMQTDKYVIVWNEDCATPVVVVATGTLAVTSIHSVDTTATANGSFTDGWEYVFHITMPTDEQDLAMKFTNWTRTGGGGTIPVANNMRISSAQANNGGATILLTAADTYSIPALHMTGDLNAVMVGRQVEVTVEVAVPNGTPNGTYSTDYGVQTTAG